TKSGIASAAALLRRMLPNANRRACKTQRFSRRSVMVSTENRTTQEHVLEDWARYWSSHEMDRLLTLFTDDVVYEDVTMGAVNHGKDELRAFGEGFFAGFPDVTFELTSRFTTGAQGGAEWVMRGTHRGDMPG